MQTFLDQKPPLLEFKKGGKLFSFQEDILALADKGVYDGLEDGLETAAQYAQLFAAAEESSGIALAKFLHGVNFRWTEFENEDHEPFWSWAVRATGRALATVQRRVCIWEFLNGEYIPTEYRESIKDFSIKMLSRAYPVAVSQVKNKFLGNYNYLPKDLPISGGQWLRLSGCADEIAVAEVVREITGKEHADRMTVKIDSSGVLRVFKGNENESIGQLFVDSNSDLVQLGITKLLEDAGISEIGEY